METLCWPEPRIDAISRLGQQQDWPTIIPTKAVNCMQIESSDRRLDLARRTIWATRPDLRDHCAHDPGRFDLWLLVHGGAEYALLREPDVRAALFAGLWADAGPDFTVMGMPMPMLALLIWQERPDLQGVFEQEADGGRAGLLVWLLGTGLRELGLVTLARQLDLALLSAPVGLQGETLPLTSVMLIFWAGRPDIRAAFDIGTLEGCRGLRDWFYRYGMVEADLAALYTPPRRAALRAALSVRFWQIDTGKADHPTDPALLASWRAGGGEAAFPVLGLLAEPVPEVPAAPAVLGGGGGLRRDGINLVGHAFAEFGVGQDVREAARALTAAGIPFTVRDIPVGAAVGAGDRFLSSHVGPDLPYAASLFCMTGMEMARVYATEGSSLFEGRHNIGFWPWELPQWPAEWQHAFDLVDEIWASSRYTYGAYRAATDKPVRHMPMAVTTAPAPLSRADLGLPEGRFLFLFAFDGLSGFARKNPLAVIQAFRQAFPRGTEPVGLVVKMMRGGAAHPDLASLLADIQRQDPRILLVDRTLPAPAMAALIDGCDCFVSLHRSEGFGRAIAEAMMLGKPVIVTGHSGNMDFTIPGTAALVDHMCRPVAAGEYPSAEGLIWAEPDIGHAAWWMRRLTADPVLRQTLAGMGQKLVSSTYSPEAVGAAYRRVLLHP